MLKTTLVVDDGRSRPIYNANKLIPQQIQPTVISVVSEPNNTYPAVALPFTFGTSRSWYANGGGGTSDKPAWIIYDFKSSPKVCVKYEIRALGDRTPVDWKIQGDQGDNNWIDLDTRVGETITPSTNYSFNITNNIAYKRYRFYCTKSYNGPDNLGLSYWVLYGY